MVWYGTIYGKALASMYVCMALTDVSKYTGLVLLALGMYIGPP